MATDVPAERRALTVRVDQAWAVLDELSRRAECVAGGLRATLTDLPGLPGPPGHQPVDGDVWNHSQGSGPGPGPASGRQA